MKPGAGVLKLSCRAGDSRGETPAAARPTAAKSTGYGDSRACARTGSVPPEAEPPPPRPSAGAER